MRNILTYLMAMTLLLNSCDGWLGVKPYDKISEDDLMSDE